MNRTGLRIDYSAQLANKERRADLGTWLRVSGVCVGLQKGGGLSLAGQVASHSAFLDVFSCSGRGFVLNWFSLNLSQIPRFHTLLCLN